ncbi:MAG: hypothetical protein ACLT5P_10185 [Flavonifractor plautii]
MNRGRLQAQKDMQPSALGGGLLTALLAEELGVDEGTSWPPTWCSAPAGRCASGRG